MKQKFISLALAVMLLLGVTGCAMSTPASVGSIGGVDIPAGIYLLAQYNAYNTASGAAKLATGETASNVKAVLKAECTGTINGEEVTTDGADYVARLTLRSLQYYAAVEKKFDELGGTLDEAATAEAAKTADTQWENNSDLYAANGISKATLEKYQLNSKKADACLKLIYGENGSSPVTEQEYADYINNDCYYLELVQLPLFDQSTYTFASDDQAFADLTGHYTAHSLSQDIGEHLQQGGFDIYLGHLKPSDQDAIMRGLDGLRRVAQEKNCPIHLLQQGHMFDSQENGMSVR